MYRGLIVDAAERLFAGQGYEQTKIQEVAAASGLSLGTLYSVFDGKADILRAVHDERLAQLFALTGDALDNADDAAARLMVGNAVFLRWLTEHPDYLRLHLRTSGAWATNPQNAADGLVDAWRRGIDLIARVIEEAISDGDLYPGDPVRLARLMVAVQQVSISAWAESGMNGDAAALVADAECHLRRLLFRSSS